MSKFMAALQKQEQKRESDIREKVGMSSRADMGDPALNWGTGSWATGRANLIYGPSGSGKSALALKGAAALQKLTGGWVFIFDSEYAYPSHVEVDEKGKLTEDAIAARKRLELFGLNPDLVYKRSSNQADQLFETLGGLEDELKKNPDFRISALIVDSWGGLQSETAGKKIHDGEVAAAGNSFGGNAKTIGPIIQTLLRISAEHGVTGIYVQHCIQNMEQYGPRWKLVGGEKLRYLVHQTLFLESVAAKDSSLMDGDIAGATDGVKVGKKIRFRCEKSRFVVEGRKGEYWFNFHQARFALPEVSLFNLATGLGVIGHPSSIVTNKDGTPKLDKDGKPTQKENNAYWIFPKDAATPSKFHGQDKMLAALREDKDLFNRVKEACDYCGKSSSIGKDKLGTEDEEVTPDL